MGKFDFTKEAEGTTEEVGKKNDKADEKKRKKSKYQTITDVKRGMKR